MKGIIVAAGYGTRFLPATKTLPKEMLPLIDKPSIAFVVEEFVASGIKDIVIITSRRKKVLDDYFDREIELEELFRREGKYDKLESIKAPDARISFVRQSEMKGTGHALLQALPLLGGEPCVVAYPDDLHFGEVPLARQLVATWEATGCSVLATMNDPGDVSRYGVVEPAADGVHVKGFVEKPSKGSEPSHEISIGRYLYTPEFLEQLAEGYVSHEKGEYYHTWALDRMISENKVAYCSFAGTRLDTGEPEGYLDAILRYAAKTPSRRAVIERFARTELGLK